MSAPMSNSADSSSSPTTEAVAPPAQATTVVAPPAQATTVDAPPAAGITQEQLNRVVQERLSREREATNKHLTALGIEGGMDALAAHVAKLQEEKEKLAKEQGDFKALYEIERQKAQALATEKATLEKQEKQRTVLDLYRQAAGRAVNPDQVARLVNAELAEQQIEVRTFDGVPCLYRDGSPLFDAGKTGVLTVENYTSQWLEKNPHFKAASPGRGTSAAPVAPTGLPDRLTTNITSAVVDTARMQEELAAARMSGNTADLKRVMDRYRLALSQ